MNRERSDLIARISRYARALEASERQLSNKSFTDALSPTGLERFTQLRDFNQQMLTDAVSSLNKLQY